MRRGGRPSPWAPCRSWFAGAWSAVAAGLVAVVTGLVIGLAGTVRPDLRRPVMAVAVGAGVVGLAGAREIGAHGLSSVLAITATAVVALLGAISMPSHRRRAVGIGAAAIAGAAVFAAAGSHWRRRLHARISPTATPRQSVAWSWCVPAMSISRTSSSQLPPSASDAPKSSSVGRGEPPDSCRCWRSIERQRKSWPTPRLPPADCST